MYIVVDARTNQPRAGRETGEMAAAHSLPHKKTTTPTPTDRNSSNHRIRLNNRDLLFCHGGKRGARSCTVSATWSSEVTPHRECRTAPLFLVYRIEVLNQANPPSQCAVIRSFPPPTERSFPYRSTSHSQSGFARLNGSQQHGESRSNAAEKGRSAAAVQTHSSVYIHMYIDPVSNATLRRMVFVDEKGSVCACVY